MQPSRQNPGRFGNALSIGLHIQVLWEIIYGVLIYLCSEFGPSLCGLSSNELHILLQLSEALCASSPDLVSPGDYQSPVDSTNNLVVPSMPVRRLSLGVSMPFSLF